MRFHEELLILYFLVLLIENKSSSYEKSKEHEGPSEMQVEATQEGTGEWETKPAEEKHESLSLFASDLLLGILKNAIQLRNRILYLICTVAKWFDFHLLISLQHELATALASSNYDPPYLLPGLLHIAVSHIFVLKKHLSGVRPHV